MQLQLLVILMSRLIAHWPIYQLKYKKADTL